MAEATQKSEVKKVFSNPVRRTLDTLDFQERRRTFELDNDTAYKGLVFKLSGSFVPEWAVDTPEAHYDGIMAALIRNIDIIADGDVHKSVSTMLLHNLAQLVTGKGEQGKYKVNDTVLGVGTQAGSYQFGTTGQSVAVRESIYLPFENHLTTKPWDTYFNAMPFTKISCAVDFQDLGYLNINTVCADFVVSSHNLKLEIIAVVDDAAANDKTINPIYKQLTQPFDFENNVEDKPLDILSDKGILMGAFLEAVWIDDEGIEIIPTADEISNMFIQLKTNGSRVLVERQSLDMLMDENQNKFQLSEDLLNWAYINLLNNSQINSGIDIASLNTLKLILTTRGLTHAGRRLQLRVHQQLVA